MAMTVLILFSFIAMWHLDIHPIWLALIFAICAMIGFMGWGPALFMLLFYLIVETILFLFP